MELSIEETSQGRETGTWGLVRQGPIRDTPLKVDYSVVTSVAIDEQYVVSGGCEGPVLLWDVLDGHCLRTLDTYSEPVSGLICFRCPKMSGTEEKENVVTVCTKDGILSKFPLERKYGSICFYTDDAMTCLTVVDGELLVAGTDDGKLVCRRAVDFRIVYSIEAHSTSVRRLAPGKNGVVASLDEHGDVSLWSLQNELIEPIGRCGTEPVDPDSGFKRYNCIAMHGNKLFAGRALGSLMAFDWVSGSQVAFPNQTSKNDRLEELSVAQNFLVSCTRSVVTMENKLHLYELDNFELLRTLKCPFHDVAVFSFRCSADLFRCVVGGSEMHILEISSVKQKELLSEKQHLEDDVEPEPVIPVKKKLRRCVIF